MVKVGGGPHALGLTRYMQDLLRRLVHDKRMLDVDARPPRGDVFGSIKID